jgi:hypothetical protein
MRRIMSRLARGLAVVGLSVLLLAVALWAGLAVYYSNLPSATARTALSVVYGAATVVALVWLRPWWRALASVAALFGAVLVWWLLIPPSNDRDWQPDVARLAEARWEGTRLTIENVRNNEYRTETDYTPRWETRSFDLANLRTTDLFLSTWGAPLVAHTIMSFGFAGDGYLAISIETRKTRGQEYSALRGFFKQYELTYVVADERDVIRLRTNYRGEEVVLYRLAVPPAVAGDVLRDYLEYVNRLRRRPEWYNALTHNCTTAIRGHTIPYIRGVPWSWKILLNGRLDEYLYEIGAVRQDLSLAELRVQGHINARARAADGSPEFSRLIRDGVPAAP